MCCQPQASPFHVLPSPPPPHPHPTPQLELSCQAKGSRCHSAGVIRYPQQGDLYFKIKRWGKQCSAERMSLLLEFRAPHPGSPGRELASDCTISWCPGVSLSCASAGGGPSPCLPAGVTFSHCAFFPSNLGLGRGTILPGSLWAAQHSRRAGPLRHKHVLSLEKERKLQSSAS